MTGVVDRLKELGVEGVLRGDEFIAKCPAHKDRTGHEDSDPSWSLNVDKGAHHCFSCGWSGSTQSLFDYLGGGTVDMVRVTPAELRAVSRDLDDLEKNRYLRGGSTGLPESELALFEDPPEWALSARNVTASSCRSLEVLWDPEGEAWVFPIRNDLGRLLGWQLKGQRDRLFRNRPIGVKKGETLFGYHAAAQSDTVHVVESPLDVVIMADIGIPAVATYGASVSAAQVSLLRQWDRVVAVFDGDSAGRRAADALFEELPTLWVAMDYPEGSKDPGDMSRNALTRMLLAADMYLDRLLED